jgi:hypothetical protein
MKRVVFSIALAFIAMTIGPCLALADQKTAVAPADEYFGRLKMSILGIRNTIHDAGLAIDNDASKAAGLMGKLNLTEDAMADWERRYPADPWIPKFVFALERVYQKVDSSAEFNARAINSMNFLALHYGNTWYGKEARRELASGEIGKHLAAPPVAAIDPQVEIPPR